MIQEYKIDKIDFKYGSLKAINNLSLEIEQGDFWGVLGPNGSGKSTLLKALTKFLNINSGYIHYKKTNIQDIQIRDLSKNVALVPQETRVSFDFNVDEIVLMGRNPHLNKIKLENHNDIRIVNEAMKATNIIQFKNRKISELSGGEIQRVIIARALAQTPKTLLLDEPTSHLDLNYQIEILNLLKQMNKRKRITIICVLHDINMASYFCDKVVILKNGEIFSYGTPNDVINENNVFKAFGVKCTVEKHPVNNKPYITLLPGKKDNLNYSNNSKVHVIGGGGRASNLLNDLYNKGFKVTTGVLNIGDSDWEQSKKNNIKIIEEAPFAHISEKKSIENEILMKEADYIVISKIPIGYGNLRNLISVNNIYKTYKKKVFILYESIDKIEDYTNGQGKSLIKQLISNGAILINSIEKLYNKLDQTNTSEE